MSSEENIKLLTKWAPVLCSLKVAKYAEHHMKIEGIGLTTSVISEKSLLPTSLFALSMLNLKNKNFYIVENVIESKIDFVNEKLGVNKDVKKLTNIKNIKR